MNRKGFTLIELLAIIIIMGILTVFIAPNIIDIYDKSKLKGEKLFIEGLTSSIDNYVKMYNDDINFKYLGNKNKVDYSKYDKINNSFGSYNVSVYEGYTFDNRNIMISNIIDNNIIMEKDYINAGNRNSVCNKNAIIHVYKDSDGVFCYKVLKSSLGCVSDKYLEVVPGQYLIDTCIWK